MKIAILTAILVLFLAIPAVSACLPAADVIEWHNIEMQFNISNNTLVNLAERQCVRSYSRDEVDLLLNLTNTKMDMQVKYVEELAGSINIEEDVEARTHEYMANYTEWFENEIEIGKLLWLIYNSTRPGNFTVNESGLATIDYVDERYGELDAAIYNLGAGSASAAGYATAETDWTTLGIVAVIILLVVALLKVTGFIPRRMPRQAAAASPAGPRVVSPEGTVIGTRIKDMEAFAVKEKLRNIREQMKKEKDLSKIDGLRKQAEEIVEEYEQGR